MMENKIKVGDYIRTYYGELAIIKEISPRIKARKLNKKNTTLLDFNLIKKYSQNIIDLIEKGDYVNGKEIIMNLEKSKKWYNSEDDFVTAKGYTYNEDEIKSIVTKEQFKNREYLI